MTGRRSAELEADAMDGLDRVFATGCGELGSDIADVAVDGAVRDLDVQLIGRGHDLLAVEHHGGPAEQGAQDAELQRGQRQRHLAEMRRVRVLIEPQPAMGKLPRLRLPGRGPRCGAAQDDVDAGHQLARAERLGDIVVAADLEPEHAVDLLVAGRQEQDRHV